MVSRPIITGATKWGTVLVLLAIGLFFSTDGGLPLSRAMTTYGAANEQASTFDCSAVSEIPAADCGALVALYNATNGAAWTDNSGWLNDNTPCDWAGINCGSNGRVSQLFLQQNGLAGTLPPELGDLTGLTWLQLNQNQISGSIPATLGNLDQVTWLRLEDNQLSGTIPAELGNMSSLQSLYLSENAISGEIPAQIGGLANLQKLYLDGTALSGALPTELGNLSQLQALTLGATSLSGALPQSFINLTVLTYFHFLDTELCEPTDMAFQAWLNGVENHYSPDLSCGGNATAEPTNAPNATPIPPTPLSPTTGPTSAPTNNPTAVPTTQPSTSTGAGLCEGLITDRNNYPMSPLAKPGYLQTVVDPEFGTTIRRITDIESTVTGEQAVIKPMYNTVQAWNADESYMILYQRSVGHWLLDGFTYEPIRNLDIRPADLEEVFWHFSNPDILFYVEPYYASESNPGQQLMRYRVSTDSSEVVRNFGNICAQNEGVAGGGDVQMMSWDSDVIGLRCVNEPARFFNYRISTDTVSPITTSGVGNDYMPWFAPQPAPSGNLMLIDNVVTDMNLNPVRVLNMQGTEHSSLGRFANGNDGHFTVAFAEGHQGGCGPGALIAHDLTDGTCRTLVGQENGYPYPPSNTHMSALAHLNPGWIGVSMVGVANNGNTAQAGQELLDNELLLVDSSPGGDVCRVAHHRSHGRGGPRGYWAEPHVVISPSGTRLLFGSDWEGGPSVDSYVVELAAYQGGSPVVPQPTQVPTEGPTVMPTAQPTSTPMPTPTPETDPTGTITGQVFEDVNGNGNYDPGEPALAEISIVLIDASTEGQTTTISTETDDEGRYRFINLPNADYRISFILPTGYVPPSSLSNQVSASGIRSVDAPYRTMQNIYLPLVGE